MRLKYAGLALLGYCALYLAIWPHELGHSVVAWFFGCKVHWWTTDMSWYLWSSWGGAIDYDCLRTRGDLSLGSTDFAGIAVNLVLLGLAPLLGRWWRPVAPSRSGASWVFVATVLWALANYAEAFSYLVINTLWLRSDMEKVVRAWGPNQWVWLAGGTGLAVLVAGALNRPTLRAAATLADAPSHASAWRLALVFFVLAASGGMAAARFALT